MKRRKEDGVTHGFRLALVLSVLVLSAVAVRGSQAEPLPADAVEYAHRANWSRQPATITHPVDVFFVHPTTYLSAPNGKYLASLDDAALNARTDAEAVARQTAPFAGSCNVFAPRYRQVNIEVLAMDARARDRCLAVPVADVTAAFTYYLKHLNGGRPFVLASHSQGSNVVLEMLLRQPGLLDKDKLVAVYAPGWTFTDAHLAGMRLPLGERPDATGVLLTWNTIGPGGASPALLPGARCVNPLSWTTDAAAYPASMNIAARIFFDGPDPLVVKHFTSARINAAGGLEIPAPRPEIADKLRMGMGKGCYHSYDYDFFFDNIAANVELRCAAYLKKHSVQQ
jgi:pimeloyl-ACP methyl ester carboxylesterase